jgi:hypothetical protein
MSGNLKAQSALHILSGMGGKKDPKNVKKIFMPD